MWRFGYSILYSTFICKLFVPFGPACLCLYILVLRLELLLACASWCLFHFADGLKAVSAQALTFAQHTAFIWVVLWPDKWLLWCYCCWGADGLRDRRIEERRGEDRGMHMKHTISLFHPHPPTHSLTRSLSRSCAERENARQEAQLSLFPWEKRKNRNGKWKKERDEEEDEAERKGLYLRLKTGKQKRAELREWVPSQDELANETRSEVLYVRVCKRERWKLICVNDPWIIDGIFLSNFEIVVECKSLHPLANPELGEKGNIPFTLQFYKKNKLK